MIELKDLLKREDYILFNKQTKQYELIKVRNKEIENYVRMMEFHLNCVSGLGNQNLTETGHQMREILHQRRLLFAKGRQDDEERVARLNDELQTMRITLFDLSHQIIKLSTLFDKHNEQIIGVRGKKKIDCDALRTESLNIYRKINEMIKRLDGDM